MHIPRNLLKISAPAKVNLHLEVLGTRKDGYHELAMVMQSINLRDYLEFQKTNNNIITLNIDNINLSNGDDNLIIKAAELIKKDSGLVDVGAKIYLNKNIPIGAGLAGGSSDAAATIFGLNILWELNYSKDKLLLLSSQLGSDIPFCISGGSQMCFGRGERLEPLITEELTMGLLLLKDPSISVSTPWAYSRCKQMKGKNYFKNEIDFEQRRQLLRHSDWINPLNKSSNIPLYNDLQEIVRPLTPSVDKALNILSSINGKNSFGMSGSGPSCFALFSSYEDAKIAFDENQTSFKNNNLEAWCCSFQPFGVQVENE